VECTAHRVAVLEGSQTQNQFSLNRAASINRSRSKTQIIGNSFGGRNERAFGRDGALRRLAAYCRLD
jgi:hypothetical protein